MLKKSFILLIPLLFAASYSIEAKQVDPQHVFERANKKLKQGHTQKALALYHKLVMQNQISGALFINMAMSYVRLDSLGKAEFYFLRAKQFEATTEKAKQGLSYVKTISAIGLPFCQPCPGSAFLPG